MSNPSRSLQPFEPPRYQFYTPSSFSPTSYTPPPLPNTFQPQYNPPTPPLARRVTTPTISGQTFSFQSPTFAPTYNPPNLPPSFLTAPMAPPITSLRTQPQNFPMPAAPNLPNLSFQANFSPVPSLPKNLATSYQPISPGIQTPSVISLPDPSIQFAGGSLPTLSGRAHFLPALQPPTSSGIWAPTLERPFSDKAIIPVPAFSSPLPAFNFTFQPNNNTHQSYLRQIEQNLKMYYLADAPPERPFPSMPFMAFQINHNMTLFADPAVMHDLFHNTTSAQKWALQSQFSEIMGRVNHSSQFSQSIAVIAVPTLPEASPSKTREFFTNLGGALKSELSNTTHQIWAFVGPMKEGVVRTKDYIATIMGQPLEQQSSEITRNGHQRIDEFFKTNLAYRHDPNYKPPIPITLVGLPLPMSGGGALVGRVGPLRAGSLGANAVRTGSIASEAIKDVAAVNRSGAVGQELSAVKNVSVMRKQAVPTVQGAFKNVVSEKARFESIEKFKKAEALLKLNTGKYLTEKQAHEILQQAGINTFLKPQGIPDKFKVKLTDKSAGLKYVHPDYEGTYVRVMPGKPHSPFPQQRTPYVNHRVNGKSLDKFGKIVENDAPEAHIPLDEFIYRE